MSQPTEIIVYRSPIEAMFWDFLINSPYVWPGIVSFMVMLAIFFFMDGRRIHRLLNRLGMSYDTKAHLILISAFLAGGVTFWWMIR